MNCSGYAQSFVTNQFKASHLLLTDKFARRRQLHQPHPAVVLGAKLPNLSKEKQGMPLIRYTSSPANNSVRKAKKEQHSKHLVPIYPEIPPENHATSCLIWMTTCSCCSVFGSVFLHCLEYEVHGDCSRPQTYYFLSSPAWLHFECCALTNTAKVEGLPLSVFVWWADLMLVISPSIPGQNRFRRNSYKQSCRLNCTSSPKAKSKNQLRKRIPLDPTRRRTGAKKSAIPNFKESMHNRSE